MRLSVVQVEFCTKEIQIFTSDPVVDANSVSDPCCAALALVGVVAARASHLVANRQLLACEFPFIIQSFIYLSG